MFKELGREQGLSHTLPALFGSISIPARELLIHCKHVYGLWTETQHLL